MREVLELLPSDHPRVGVEVYRFQRVCQLFGFRIIDFAPPFLEHSEEAALLTFENIRSVLTENGS